MAARSIFSPENQEFIARAYLEESRQPSEVTELLNQRFSTNFTVVQVQRHINRDLSKQRRVTARKRAAIQKKTASQIAREQAAETQRVLGRFADKSKQVTDKALDMAIQADNPRSLNAATSAAKAALTMFRVCSGLEDGSNAGPRSTVFNFNFASAQPLRDGEQPALEAQVVETDDDLVDEDDAELAEIQAPEQAAPKPQQPSGSPASPAS